MHPGSIPGQASNAPAPAGPPRDTIWTDARLRRVWRGAGILLGGRTVNALIGLAYVAVAARALGPDRFGVLVLIVAFASTVIGLVKFQSWQAVLQYGSAPLAAGRFGDLQRIIRFSGALDLGSGLAGAAIGAAGAALFATALGFPEQAGAAAAYATVGLFGITSTATGVLRLYDRFDLLAWEAAIGMGVRLVGALSVWSLGGGLVGLLIANYLAEVASFIYLQACGVHELRRRGHLAGFRWLGGDWTRGFPGLWRFVWTTNLNTTLGLTFTHLGLLIVGGALGPAAAALYRVARQVGDALAKPARLVTAALYPELARMWVERDMAALHRLCLRLALTAGVAATALLAVAAVAGGPALALIAGEGFRAGAPVLTLLVAASAIGIWALPLEPLLMSTGRAGWALGVRLVGTVAYLAAVWPLMAVYGLVGAGLAAIGSTLLISAGMLWVVWRRPPDRSPPIEAVP